ncbi:hypothetical protein KC887_02705 [Candidatus Kaiserbacteria bacterium]|nr:hypothetical protein [Candidatus Kaiserbacteria bacterium]
MPDSLRFEIFDDASVGTTYDFLTAGLKPIIGTWRIQKLAGRMMHTVLLAIRDTATNIRTDVNDLEDLLDQASLHINDALEKRSVWYRAQTDSESAKRSLVYDFELVPVDSAAFEVYLTHEAAQYALSFTTDGSSEEDTAQTASTSALSCLGGVWNLSGSISGGRVNGRIDKLLVEPQSSTVNKMWIGVRPLRELSGSFTAAYDTTALTGTGVTTTADANSRSGSYSNVSFSGGEDMILRFSNRDFGSGSQNYIGRFLILLRCRVSSSGTICNIRASTSLQVSGSDPTYNDPLNLGSTQYVSSTSFQFVELGEFEFPPYRGHSRQTMVNMRINLEVGRIAGSGNFHADCYVLIPADHMVTWSGLNVANTGGGAFSTDPMQAYFYTFPDNTIEGFLSDGFAPSPFDGNPFGLGTVTAKDWAYPFDGGVLVFASQREGIQNISDTVDVSLEVFRKWTTYRV